MEQHFKVVVTGERLKLSPYRKDMTLENFKCDTERQREVFDNIKKNPDDWFVFYGSPGTGKSHLATALARLKDKKEKSVCMVKFRFICSEIRSDFSKEREVIEYYSGFDLLVIEEVGRGYNSGFESAALFEIIDNRYEGRKQTIITTNMDKNELAEFMGEATVDRFREIAIFVKFDWDSYRKLKE